MPDSRDSTSQRANGRMAWDDDQVEIHDLDPALDLEVFAEDDLGAFVPATPKDETPPPPRRVAEAAPPLPAVVSDDEIAIPPPPPVVVRFRRTAPNSEMRDLLDSGGNDPPPAYARTEVAFETTQPSRPPAVRPGTEASRRSREYLPLVASGVLVVVALAGGTYEWRRRAAASSVAPVSATASRGTAAESTRGQSESPAAPGAVSTRPELSEPVKRPRASAPAPRSVPISASRSAGGGGRTSGNPSSSSAASSVRSPRPPSTPPTVEGAVATAGRVGLSASLSRPAPAAPVRPRQPAAPPRDASGAIAGWLRIDAASELQLTVDGVAMGSTRQAPLLLAAGTHNLEVASDRAGVRTATRVTVAPGQVAVVPITLPQGTLSVTAQPDADVFVDGQPAGRTPVDRVALTVGVRRILVRSALGERTYEIVVREGRQTQLSVDLRPR